GFPGETDAEFEESRAFIAGLPFTYLHVFTYSERPGTPAAAAPESIPLPVRKERNRILRELAAAKNRAFRERMGGHARPGVTLHEPLTALTDNYLKVELAHYREPNRIVDLKIGGLSQNGLREATSHGVLPLLSRS